MPTESERLTVEQLNLSVSRQLQGSGDRMLLWSDPRSGRRYYEGDHVYVGDPGRPRVRGYLMYSVAMGCAIISVWGGVCERLTDHAREIAKEE